MAISLPPPSTLINGDPRLDVLTTFLTNADQKVNHIDGLRQRYMTIALVIFAGLFGFGLKLDNMIAAISTSGALTAVTIVFCLLDRKLHKLSHGWRETREAYTKNIETVLADPSNTITVHRYVSRAEKNAEWFSVQPALYYFLIVGGVASIVAFALVGKW